MEKARGPPMNEEIQFPEVRVVLANPDGKDDMLGIMPRDEAIRRAEDEGMDLILVSPEATPPVCKITSYDKMRYEEEKKAKAMKRGSKNAELKEVKLSYKIDTHDYEVRKRAAIKFLTKGDKVKASIRFKGREMAHRELAKSTMQKLLADCVDLAVCEKMPVVDGRMMQMIMAPTVEVMKASDLKKKQREKAKSKVAKKGEVVVSSDEEEESEDEDDLDALNAEISDDDEDDEEEESLIDYDIDMMGSEEVTAKIAEVGERVRALKENGASKEKVGAHVDELLALKARYVELTGETWAPAS
mmetsp:Transcript_55465/g.131713  ORF Transcript_55465/g.131713 Transcript_55465/m.131713 type:complete len:301 (-) Transcript_55465:60-962(-)